MLSPVICAKQYGLEDVLADVIADAVLIAGSNNSIDIDNIRVVKVVGGDISCSHVIRGMVFPRVPDGNTPSSF